MGFLFKSVIGLGCVYGAIFGQSLRSTDIAPKASPCAIAAKAAVAGNPALRAQWAAAGCVLAIAAETRPPSTTVSVAARAPRTAPITPSGTLTEADLRDPWFGPARMARKSERRG